MVLILLTTELCLLNSSAQVPELLNIQGRLLDGGGLVNSNVALSLRLFDAPAGGILLYEDSSTVSVVDGLYATFMGDDTAFGNLQSALAATSVYVETAVNGVALAPRERLSATAYSLATREISIDTNVPPNVVLAGSVNTISESVRGSSVLGGSNNTIVTGSHFASILGGSDNLIGTNSFNAAIHGGSMNRIGENSEYAIIGGGAFSIISGDADRATIAGGASNFIGENSRRSAIGGGSVVFIGKNSEHSTVGGGEGNTLFNNASWSTIGGGMANIIGNDSFESTIAGGALNFIGTNSPSGAIPGGANNEIGDNAPHAFAAGRRAKANHPGTFVWADSTDADFVSTSSNQFLIRAAGGVGIGTDTPTERLTVAGNLSVEGTATFTKVIGDGSMISNIVGAAISNGTILEEDVASNTFWATAGNSGTTAGTHFLGTTDDVPLELHVNGLRVLRIEDDDLAGFPAPRIIGGSASNSITGFSAGAVIAGGINNHIGASVFSSVGGGRNNNVADGSDGATIAGGASNDIGANAQYPAVGGGLGNKVADFSFYATIPGGQNNDIGVNSSFSAVGGGGNNNVAGNSNGATIGGGNGNDVGENSPYTTVAGGQDNAIGTNSSYSTVGGGENNEVADNSHRATIAGGEGNDIGTNSNYSTVSGGFFNDVADNCGYAVIAGGQDNVILSGTDYTAVGGGFENVVAGNGSYSTIPGGRQNAIGSFVDYAFAAGRRAKANHDGAFVWADSTNADFVSQDSDQFLIRASNGVGINVSNTAFNALRIQDANWTAQAGGGSFLLLESLSPLIDAGALFGKDKMLRMVAPSSSESTTEFITCQWDNGDDKFRVEMDGDAFADGAFSGGGADFAEMVSVTEGSCAVEPGDVLAIDPTQSNGYTKCYHPRSHLVAGVYSTQPGFRGWDQDWEADALEDTAPMAVVGIVPCKVSTENGAIGPGDLLVTASLPGHAMRDPDPAVGTVVGKALDALPSGTGVIKILVTLQ